MPTELIDYVPFVISGIIVIFIFYDTAIMEYFRIGLYYFLLATLVIAAIVIAYFGLDAVTSLMGPWKMQMAFNVAAILAWDHHTAKIRSLEKMIERLDPTMEEKE